jgi:hypothetical protein
VILFPPDVDVAVDPAVHSYACAELRNGTLSDVYTCTLDDIINAVGAPRSVTIENPRINGASRGKDKNDMMDLAVAVGALRGAFSARGVTARLVTPQQWKGSIKKPPHHLAMWLRLTDDERLTFCEGASTPRSKLTPAIVEAKIREACRRLGATGAVTGYAWAAHNLLDAVALGKWGASPFGKILT